MKYKALLAALAVAFGVGGSTLIATAASATPVPTCTATRVTVTHLDDRPDNGNHGTWAQDYITRVVKFCEGAAYTPPVIKEDTPQVDVKLSWYTAVVTDFGTFITNGGVHLSPQAGALIVGGVHGKVVGGYTATFIAESNFKNYTATYNGHTYNGTNPSTTPDFVKNDWGGKDFKGSSLNDDWKWTYTTCSEKWVDGHVDDGALPVDGDIVGKACPKPSPSPTASKTASPSPTPTGGSTTPPVVVVAPAPAPVQGSLTVTG